MARALKTSDLAAVRKGLIKVTQALRKMRETFELMHSKFKLNLNPSSLKLTLGLEKTGADHWIVTKLTGCVRLAAYVDPTAFHGTLRIFVSG